MRVHLYPAPQDVDRAGPMQGVVSAGFWVIRTGGMQDPGYELPRIPLPRRWVNSVGYSALGEEVSSVVYRRTC